MHDYYALGLVLLEIAIWRSLKSILEKHTSLQRDQCSENEIKEVSNIILDEDSRENHLGEIAFRMGDIYRDVIERCLRGDFVRLRDTPDMQTIAFSREVVERLGKCVI